MPKKRVEGVPPFLRVPTPGSQRELSQLSPQVAAYVGDAVFELYIRTFLVQLEGQMPINELHHRATSLARAGGQASLLQEVLPLLSEEELTTVRRGRNAGGRVPRGAKVKDYRYATGLEALLGTLYLEGKTERLHTIMARIMEAVEDV